MFYSRLCRGAMQVEIDMETWNERLASAMQEKGYGLTNLANRVGVSEATVAAWVGAANMSPARDLRSLNMLAACAVLGVCPEWLMLGEMPKLAVERWPFTTALPLLLQMPACEMRRIDRFLADTLTIWAANYMSADDS